MKYRKLRLFDHVVTKKKKKKMKQPNVWLQGIAKRFNVNEKTF